MAGIHEINFPVRLWQLFEFKVIVDEIFDIILLRHQNLMIKINDIFFYIIIADNKQKGMRYICNNQRSQESVVIQT